MTHSTHSQPICSKCQAKVIEYIKKDSLYPSVTHTFKNKNRYNFRKNIKLKYLAEYILNMTLGAELTHIDISDPHWNCEHFGENYTNEFRFIKQAYYRHIIKSYFISEIFNTITSKNNKHLLKILKNESQVMSVIICKLYEIRENEPITSNLKGYAYYFNEIINMPLVLYEQGIPIEHYHRLHNKLGKHSEFEALIHGNPMASHGLMFDSINQIIELYESH